MRSGSSISRCTDVIRFSACTPPQVGCLLDLTPLLASAGVVGSIIVQLDAALLGNQYRPALANPDCDLTMEVTIKAVQMLNNCLEVMHRLSLDEHH